MIKNKDAHIIRNSGDNFEIDYEKVQMDRNIYFSLTPRIDGKKAVGIICNDLNKNLMKKHPLFLNQNLYKTLYARKTKFDKFESLFAKEK
jgi:hypothetical protein